MTQPIVKAVILAGGLGSRLSEETARPAEADGRDRRQADPLAHHEDLLRTTASTISSICLGYKGYVIKEYFANYFLHMSDVTFDLRNNRCDVHQQHAEPWRSRWSTPATRRMTGGRLKRVRQYVDEHLLLHLRRRRRRRRHHASSWRSTASRASWRR